MHLRDSDCCTLAGVLRGSEGPSGCLAWVRQSHFPVVCVNECWDRVTSPRIRWLPSGSVIDPGALARARHGCRGTCSLAWAGPLALLRLSSMADCVQCAWTAVAREWGRVHTVPRSLAVIWFHATRLETRTKESNMCASLRVIETRGTMKVKVPSRSRGGICPPRAVGSASSTDLFYS